MVQTHATFDRREIKLFSIPACVPLFLIVSEIHGRKVSKWWNNRNFFKLFGPPCRNPVTFYTRMCAGLCPTYWTTFGIADKNRIGSCPMHEWDHPPIFGVFNSLSPPRGRWTPQGKGARIDRHFTYTNKIWYGSVHALLRYRSKSTKMQKFPIDSH